MRLTAEQRRALRLLAGNPRGCTEAILLAHGFTGRSWRSWSSTGWRPPSQRKCVLADVLSKSPVSRSPMKGGGRSRSAAIRMRAERRLGEKEDTRLVGCKML